MATGSLSKRTTHDLGTSGLSASEVREKCLQSAFLAMSFLLWFQLVVLLITTFKRKSSFYYRSMVLASIGLFLWILGILMANLLGLNAWLTSALCVPGYLIFVPSGQSVQLLASRTLSHSTIQSWQFYTLGCTSSGLPRDFCLPSESCAFQKSFSSPSQLLSSRLVCSLSWTKCRILGLPLQ
jgi:hypothetical protein